MNRTAAVIALFCSTLLVTLSAFAAGGREIPAPAITLDLPGTSYISPGVADETQDSLSWSVSIAASERMVIKGYRIVISDRNDEEVYRFEETYPGQQPFFQRLFIGVGFARFKEPVTIPQTLSWSGVTTSGTPVAEGRYSLVVEGRDDQDRTGSSNAYTVVVDNTPPSARISLPYQVFSPNADANKDVLIVEQTGSEEVQWTGTVFDQTGAVIYQTSWENSSPENLIWDGTDGSGTVAEDGTYRYLLSATDLAGNSFSVSDDHIVIDTKDTPVSITRNVAFFSPNEDESIDTITFGFNIPVTSGVSQWRLEILDANERVRRTMTGTEVADQVTFDGKTDAGAVLPEGAYRARLSVLYVNGNNPTATSAPFTIDVTAPVVSVKAFPLIFSPNGDGNKDTIQIYQETTLEESWVGRAYDESDKLVRTIEWRGRADGSIVWDGRNDENELLPDGVYRYVLSTTDRAGNYAEAVTDEITLDTRETPVSFSADTGYFSPNADGVRDTIALIPDISDPRGVTSLEIALSDDEGNPVRSFVRTEAVEMIEWDGRNDANQAAPNGEYYADLTVEYAHGNVPTARIGPLVIDRTVPSLKLSASDEIFSPDNDGNQDEIRIEQLDSTSEESWTGTITNESGEAVRMFEWTGRATSFVWNGTDAEGNVVPDGNYRYVVASTDRAGNEGTFSIDRITIDTRPTPVTLRIGSAAFSPNGDGVKDILVITPVLAITDNIDNWHLEIRGENGETVTNLRGNARVPVAIEFEGDNDRGDLLPEGSYGARLSILYKNGNNPSAESPVFILDNTRPDASLSVAPKLFSPNGDGRKDTTVILQDGTPEDSWRGWIVNEENQIVRTFRFIDSLESRLVWDGKDDTGRIVADGEYGYFVAATDHAGNAWESDPVTFRVDNRATSLALEAQPLFFSPNQDGVQDTVRITPRVTVNEGIERHVLEIIDDDGTVVRSFSGSGSVPTRVSWNGRTAAGSAADDGIYSAQMTIDYEKGDRVTAETGRFVIDTTAPQATVSADTLLFSPEGDGLNDTIVIRQNTSAEELWEGKITDEDGRLVRNVFWQGRAGDFTWNGTDDNGSTVADGRYRYELISSDRGGNRVAREVTGIEIDTRVASAYVSVSPTAFSPDGDGERDSVRFNLYPTPKDGITGWSFNIIDGSSQEVRNLTSGSQTDIPTTIEWDGRNDSGRVVDGTYRARLVVEYAKGDRPEAETPDIIVDTEAPTAQISAETTIFSPDGDSRKDSVRIRQQTSVERLWIGTITNSANRIVRRETWSGSAPDFVWDGRDNSGSIVPDGTYSYQLTATDVAENSVTRRVTGITVDTRGTTVTVSASERAISPNGDGRTDSARIDLSTSLNEGVESWSLLILDTQGRAIRDLTLGPARIVPESVIWDGRDDDGVVREGTFTPRFTVTWQKGNVADDEASRPILVDVSPPQFTVSTTPTPFSPDDDGENDVATIAFSRVRDASPIESWQVRLVDPYGNTFFKRGGPGAPPASFEWDGYSEEGELVQAAEDYRVETTMIDDLGNRAEKTTILPVDVLVIREGDVLKIRISSIQFAPNSPDFLEFDEEKAERNLKTLTRLAEILRKYASYQIRIEGHAVSVYWANPERAKREETEELKPLSKARADAVKAALVDLGIPESRMDTVGMGGTQPVVPHGDLENRWKSRRVEFILLR